MESQNNSKMKNRIGGERWFFTKEELSNTPTTKRGYDSETEQLKLQYASYYIHKMSVKMKLPSIATGTAVLYLQRFYMCHPMQVFDPDDGEVTAAALFLAAKVEEHPRKLEIVLETRRYVYKLPGKSSSAAKDILFYEDLLITTLGFDLHVQHAHKFVIKMAKDPKFNFGKTITEISYKLVSSVLKNSRFNLLYKPDRIAYLCIHMAQSYVNLKIPLSHEGKPWYKYCDESLTEEILNTLMDEFTAIIKKCPEELKNFDPQNIPSSQVKVLPSVPTQSHMRASEDTREITKIFEAKLVAADEKSHDPEKHFRKMNPTPTKKALPMHVSQAVRPAQISNAAQRHGSDSRVKTDGGHQRTHRNTDHISKMKSAAPSSSHYGNAAASQKVGGYSYQFSKTSIVNATGVFPETSTSANQSMKRVILEQLPAMTAPKEEMGNGINSFGDRQSQEHGYADKTNPRYVSTTRSSYSPKSPELPVPANSFVHHTVMSSSSSTAEKSKRPHGASGLQSGSLLSRSPDFLQRPLHNLLFAERNDIQAADFWRYQYEETDKHQNKRFKSDSRK